jgi:hypothetical protein
MKIIQSQLLTLYAVCTNVLDTTAFTVQPSSPRTLSSPLFSKAQNKLEFEIFPTYETLDYVESGSTVRTYPIPGWAERVQMRFETNGRPLKGEANLWTGPIRKVHTLKFDTESGIEFPIEATLKFKKASPVLKVSTADNQNYPMKVGVFIPPPERADEIGAYTGKKFDEATSEEKKRIQGSNTDGRFGMRENWVVPVNVDSVQVIAWSKDTGKKSFKLDIELIQGPNNVKQSYFLQCGGGSQPYHAVFQTPGSGWVVRIRNKKYVEDGLIEVAVVPYESSPKETGKRSLGWS